MRILRHVQHTINKTKKLKKSLKKNIRTKCRNNTGVEVYFQDESRFGTHSKLGHGWFNKGERPLVKMKMGFENFYMYTAIHATNGDDFSLVLPKANTQCMNIFLEQLSKKCTGKDILLVTDRAAWHKSASLIVPENITIMLLPPYSPELNPVERLWNYLKSKLIKNKIYQSIDQLLNAIQVFMNNLMPDVIKNICSANYLIN